MAIQIALNSNLGIDIFQRDIPIEEQVSSACELLGLDPLYVANEGLFLSFVQKMISKFFSQSKPIHFVVVSGFNFLTCKDCIFFSISDSFCSIASTECFKSARILIKTCLENLDIRKYNKFRRSTPRIACHHEFV